MAGNVYRLSAIAAAVAIELGFDVEFNPDESYEFKPYMISCSEEDWRTILDLSSQQRLKPGASDHAAYVLTEKGVK